MAKVLSIHISPKRGTTKGDVFEVQVLEGWGLEGDAHGGNWDRLQRAWTPVYHQSRRPFWDRA